MFLIITDEANIRCSATAIDVFQDYGFDQSTGEEMQNWSLGRRKVIICHGIAPLF